MPSRPLRPCSFGNGCPELVEKGPCPTHAKEQDASRRRSETWRKVRGARGGMVDVYTTTRWRLARAAYLAKNPLCVECFAAGRVEAATAIDHRTPHRGDMTMFWDKLNWQSLCATHHSRKTASEVLHA